MIYHKMRVPDLLYQAINTEIPFNTEENANPYTIQIYV